MAWRKSLLRYISGCLWGFLVGLIVCHPLIAQQRPLNQTQIADDSRNLLPLADLSKHNIAVVTPSKSEFTAFVETLNRYADIKWMQEEHNENGLEYCNTVIVAGTTKQLQNQYSALIKQLVINRKKVIIAEFVDGTFFLSGWLPKDAAYLKTRDIGVAGQQDIAMSIFGGLAVVEGQNKREKTRLQYGVTNFSKEKLQQLGSKIDAIANQAVREKAAPAVVVMVIKDGQVLFEKAYGNHTYDNKIATKATDIFDMASITKIAATTPVIMHLYDQKLIQLDSTVGYYLSQAKSSNKANTTLRTVLLHEGGFTPFIPFYRDLKPGDVQKFYDVNHQVKMADSAYLLSDYYRKIMWPTMLKSPIKNEGKYVYSDISMYIMKEVAEHQTSAPMERYVQDFLYRPIGMKTAGYLPRNRFARERIVPTQDDTSFRKVLLEGYVHDEGAAMAGGVAGHAGLFATANDLAIYGQMLLNRGFYGGVQFIQPETVDLFSSNQSRVSRRGLGFDRFDPDLKKEYPSKLANSSVYGHTGYTGTCIWIDPKNQMIYIFLSNRVHPQVSTKLYELNTRSRIQDAIYESIIQ